MDGMRTVEIRVTDVDEKGCKISSASSAIKITAEFLESFEEKGLYVMVLLSHNVVPVIISEFGKLEGLVPQLKEDNLMQDVKDYGLNKLPVKKGD